MKPSLFLLLVLCCSVWAFSQAPVLPAHTITKIFIVRHADRTPEGDDLSPAGLVRADELRRVLSKADIDSIFSTNTVRTNHTVKPLAMLRGRPVTLYDTEPQVITRILANSAGKRVLVAGHSNTVAKLIRQCGCTPPAPINPNIPDTQFDNLFEVIVHRSVVNRVASSTCEVIWMKYGAVTN